MQDFLNILIEPFTFPFIQRALVLAIMVGVVCSLLSCFLILKGWSLIGDAISHSILPGVIISYVMGMPIVIGALIAGILSTTIMGAIQRKTKLKEDCIVGIVFSSMFALGLFLFSIVETELHITHILFGNILGIDKSQVINTLLLLIVISIVLLVKSKDLLLFCFDEKQMAMQGISVLKHHYLLLILLSLTIVVSMQVIGVLFVVGLLIIPGMFGFLCSKQFLVMVFCAILFTTVTIIVGIILSFYLDVATTPLIVVIQTITVFLAFGIHYYLLKLSLRDNKIKG